MRSGILSVLELCHANDSFLATESQMHHIIWSSMPKKLLVSCDHKLMWVQHRYTHHPIIDGLHKLLNGNNICSPHWHILVDCSHWEQVDQCYIHINNEFSSRPPCSYYYLYGHYLPQSTYLTQIFFPDSCSLLTCNLTINCSSVTFKGFWNLFPVAPC